MKCSWYLLARVLLNKVKPCCSKKLLLFSKPQEYQGHHSFFAQHKKELTATHNNQGLEVKKNVKEVNPKP
jgi:hypothetical protein